MIEFGMHTAVGTRHEVNEDALGHSVNHGLWLVADGMGGHAAGDVASSTVRDRILQAVAEGDDLAAAVQAAHEAVLAKAAEDPERAGMGSTVVAVQILDEAAHVAWVGDSRLYLLRDGDLQQVTRDHSMVQWLLQSGAIDADAARRHPDRNVLVRTLGFDQPVADVTRIDLEAGDRLLLCSDGVSGVLSDSEIRTTLMGHDPEQAAAALVHAVVERRGNDDASAIVICAGGSGRRTASAGRHDRTGLAWQQWWPAIAGGGLGLLIFLIWSWMKSS
jgi:PPM family protein phosphatase